MNPMSTLVWAGLAAAGVVAACPLSSFSDFRLRAGRYGLAAASLDSCVYVAGGCGDEGARGDVECLVLERCAVVEYPTGLLPRFFHASAVLNEHLVLVGGLTKDRQKTGLVEAFHSSGKVTALPPLPEPVARPGAAVWGDRLYVIGGEKADGHPTGMVQIYDARTKTWSRGADMPVAREGMVAVKDGKIYAPGGYNGRVAITDFQVYNIAADRWERLPDLPVKMSAHSGVIVGDTLYTFGDYEVLDRVAACELATGEWTLLDIGYRPSRHNAAVLHNYEVLVIGGNMSTSGPVLDDIQRFSLGKLAAAPRRPWTADSEPKPVPRPSESRPPASAGYSILVGTVRDGTPDYSDRAFARLKRAARGAVEPTNERDSELFGKALARLLQPRGTVRDMEITLRSRGREAVEYSTRSDNDGRFEFGGLAPGEYLLTVTRPGGRATAPLDLTWHVYVANGYATHTRVWLTLPPEFVTAKGRVVDREGHPVSGARVTAESFSYSGELGTWLPYAHIVTAATDDAGSYTLPGLHPANAWTAWRHQAEYVLRIEADGFAPSVRPLKVITKTTHRAAQRMLDIFQTAAPPGEQRETKEIPLHAPADIHNELVVADVTLARAAALGGRVVDAAGNVLTNARVSLRPEKDVPKFLPPRSYGPEPTGTDAAGRFVFSGLPPGHYTLTVGAPDRSLKYPDSPIELREGEIRDDLDLRYAVPPEGRIEAVVRDATTGEPIANYTAYVYQVVSETEYLPSHGRLRKSATSKGHFSVEGMSPGRAQLELAAPGYVAQRISCEVLPGQTTELPLALERAGIAWVKVTQKGALVRPYQLKAFPEGSTNAVFWPRTVDEEGWCVFPGLKPGLHQIQAEILTPDQTRYATAPVRIEADKISILEMEVVGPGAKE